MILIAIYLICRSHKAAGAAGEGDRECIWPTSIGEPRHACSMILLLAVGMLRRGERGGLYSYHAWPQSYDHRPSHPYNAGTEHVGFSRTTQKLLAPIAKHREVLGESHEG